MHLHCPYRLSDGTNVLLVATIHGSEVLHAEVQVDGETRGINGAEHALAISWAAEEVAIRDASGLLRGPAQLQFLDCAGGFYGPAGMLAAAATAAALGDPGEPAATALRARSRRLANRTARRAALLIEAGGLAAEDVSVLASIALSRPASRRPCPDPLAPSKV